MDVSEYGYPHQTEELALVDRLIRIVQSTPRLDETCDRFACELQRLMSVDWAAVTILNGHRLHVSPLSPRVDSTWELGDYTPAEGTATTWLAKTVMYLFEEDLKRECRFWTGEIHVKHGLRSVAHLPLIAENKVFGALVVGSRQPCAYTERELRFLRHMASHMAHPLRCAILRQETQETQRINRRLATFISWTSRAIRQSEDITEIRKRFVQRMAQLTSSGALDNDLSEDTDTESLFDGDKTHPDLLKHESPLDSNEVMHLTPTEFALLSVMVRNSGRVMTHQQLMQRVWGEYYPDDTQYIRTYIRRLRKKLGHMFPGRIVTEHGIGYKFTES